METMQKGISSYGLKEMIIGTSLALFFFLIPKMGSAQFQINGDAFQENDSCYVITPDQMSQSGSIWSSSKINLTNPFDIKFRMHFGCPNGQPGADGFVVALQPVSTSVGGTGGGLGYEGISPSMGVEFDTYQNSADKNDPAQDHMAILQNGNLNHASSDNLAGPVSVHPAGNGIEDCGFHWVRITWDPDSTIFRVYYDCDVRLFYQGDIINNIFGGDPEVFWGVTGGTGFYHNRQEVCILDTSFIDAQDLSNVSRCDEDSIQLEVGHGNLVEINWEPTTFISDPKIHNPQVYPEATTTYKVEITDECQLITYDTITIYVPDTLGWAQDTLCHGESILLEIPEYDSVRNYFWNGIETPSRILEVTEEGVYVGEIHQFDCIITDSVEISQRTCDVPNIITPNDDMVNEKLDLSAAMEGELTLWDLQVFNRWGKPVYLEVSYNNEWSGDNLPDGMYHYQLNHQTARKSFKGWFTIAR